jgi:hypothetical protein
MASQALMVPPWALGISCEAGRGLQPDILPGEGLEDLDLGLYIGVFRIFDPLILGVKGGLQLEAARAGTWLASLGISAIEALSERFFLRFASRVEVAVSGAKGPAWAGAFELGFGLRFGAWQGGFGSRVRAGTPDFNLDAGLDLEAEGGER